MAPTMIQGREFRTEHKSQFVSIRVQSGVLTVRPAGPSLSEREALIIAGDVKTILAACGKGLRSLLLDLSSVQAMSSFGLGMCIDLRNMAHRTKANTTIYGLCPELRDLFKMMKVDRLYTIASTPRELELAIRS